jgi:hypothetical protein
MRFEISVTAEDIAQGVRRSCHLCPVAIAARRVVLNHGSEAVIEVGAYTLICLDNKTDIPIAVGPLPFEVVRQIRRFDYGHKIEPFDFELDLTLTSPWNTYAHWKPYAHDPSPSTS